jgi:cytochrome P450
MADSATAINPKADGRRTFGFDVYNPFSPDFIHDPRPTWNRLLEDYPLAWHREMELWLVCPHDLAFEALRTPKFSMLIKDWEKAPPPVPEDQKTDFHRAAEFSLLAVPPAQHVRQRKLTQPAFSRAVMDQIELKIRDLFREVFDELADRKEIDVVTDVAERLPMMSIARMVGVPRAEEALFNEGLGYNLVRSTDPLRSDADRAAAIQGTLPGFKFLREHIAKRRAAKDVGDDFLGMLIKSEIDGDKLNDWEITALITALITAGADTVLDLYMGAAKTLLEHPDQYKMLRENPDLMENAVLEVLRYSIPGKVGPIPRFVSEDMEWGGQPMKKGELVMVAMSAAWSDPKRWDNPDKFDITRNQDGNIIFGAGPHFCIGLNLVKTQGKLFIEEFTRRFPNAELTGEMEYDYHHFNARRLKKLMVRTNI